MRIRHDYLVLVLAILATASASGQAPTVTFDHVQPDDLKQQGAVAAVFAWYAANWPKKRPRRQALR